MPTDNAPTPVHEAGSGGGPPPPAALGAQPAGAVLKHKGDDVHQSYTDHTPRMKKPKVKESIIDHTYRDYSMVQVSDDEDEAISATSDEKKHTRLQPNFPAKLHAIVSNPKYDHIIAWQPHGRSWIIKDKHLLSTVICPKHFAHAKFESFNRSVNGWGFKRLLNQGPDYKSYYHECFLRGRPELTKLMHRLVSPGKRLPDKAGEPDLYEISRKYPLPKVKGGKQSNYDDGLSPPPRMGAPGPHGYNMYGYPQPSPHAHPHQQAYWPSPTGSPPYQQGPYGQQGSYGYYPYPPHMMMMNGQQGGPPRQMMMPGQQGGPMMMPGQQGGPMMMPGPNGGYYFVPPYHQPPANGYPQQYPLQAPTAEPQDGQAGPPGADGARPDPPSPPLLPQDGPPGENGGQVGPPGPDGGQDGPPGPEGGLDAGPTAPSDAANDAEKLKEAEHVAPEADGAKKDSEEPKVEPDAPAAEATKDTEESDEKKSDEQGERVTV